MNTCPRPDCSSTDVTNPFEMDGISDGVYQASGLWWVACRECHRTSRVAACGLKFYGEHEFDDGCGWGAYCPNSSMHNEVHDASCQH